MFSPLLGGVRDEQDVFLQTFYNAALPQDYNVVQIETTAYTARS